VLVDEVYLEALYERRPRPAVHLGDHFLVTSSLTKAYGLSGLRCGWVLANPELTQRMWHINDLYGVNAAHPAELMSVIALDNLERVAARAKKLLAANRPVLDSFLRSRDDIEYVRPEFGTSRLSQVLHGTVDQLDRLLREEYETSVVPGSYFGMPEHFRVGIGGDPEMTRAGLERLGLALDKCGANDQRGVLWVGSLRWKGTLVDCAQLAGFFSRVEQRVIKVGFSPLPWLLKAVCGSISEFAPG
jgi:aspartate/methionine/tyrosine aminotransferase